MLVTLHRPSNVDEPRQLRRIVAALVRLAAAVPVVFPIHPRTRARLEAEGLLSSLEDAGVRCFEPVGYLDFLSLEIGAGAIVTDSGGVQEEAAALGVPCFTLRRNTERPVTITRGTNTLLGDDPAAIAGDPAGGDSRGGRPSIAGWDGRAGERVADAIEAALERARPRRGGRGMTAVADRAEVLGCEIDRIDMAEAARRCDGYVRTRAGAQHMAVNAAKIVAMRHDAALRGLVDGCELITADGQAVVWASRLLGDPLPVRVAGIDLMLELLALAEQRGYSVYVLGARQDVLERALAQLRARHPAAAHRGLPRRLLRRGRGAVCRGGDPRRATGPALRGHVHTAQGVLPRPLGPRARRSVLDGRRRRRRRHRRDHEAGAANAAATRPRVGLPAGAGAAPALPPLSHDQPRVPRAHPARPRARPTALSASPSSAIARSSC